MSAPYCRTCGQQSLIQKDQTTETCSNCSASYWNNPKATVTVVMFNDEQQVLFSKRAIEPRKGTYDLPGGFVEYGEDVFDACVREIQEETSTLINKNSLRIITAYTLEYVPDTSVVDLIIVCSDWQGIPQAADDSAALEWKSIDFINDPQFSPGYTDLANILNASL